jgi:type III secretion protein V
MDAILRPIQNFVALAARRSDLVLAVILMAVVFMLVLPLPTALVDALIAINIGVSALLLMVAMYLPNPLGFASFPSVLLITTLFRLALSIATTRLILLQADAGHIVEAFGNFVVGGNLVVGLVVFLILTIVQFIVITKGAERVAEVAARFSLDAMPGKQMSIDADMRAGAIDMNEARRRRRTVEKESQLYGAMDGAVKFVKGDAIASIIIVFVNLIGGMLIGTLQRGLSAGEAMAIYSVLTIGDGLIAQIPALLISITAGMIVTRVTSGEGNTNVGRDITDQVLAQPQALLVAAAIMLGFALVPGMPSGMFLGLGGVGGLIGFVILKPRARGPDADGKVGEAGAYQPVQGAGGEGADPAGAANKPLYVLPSPLAVEIALQLQPQLNTQAMLDSLAAARKSMYFELGLPLPGVNVRYVKIADKDAYQIVVNDIAAASGYIRPGHVLAQADRNALEFAGVAVLEGPAFLPDRKPFWVAAQDADKLRGAGVGFLEPGAIVAHHLRLIVRKHARDFIGVQEIFFLQNEMQNQYPELVKELQRVIPTQRMAEVLQRLVAEGVSVRNLRSIAEALVEWGGKERDVVVLTEHVRTALRRQISHSYASGGSIAAYLIAPELEETIRNGVRQTSMGSYLALEPELTGKIVEAVQSAVGDLTAGDQRPVLLTPMDIRRYMRKMIEDDIFNLPVLSFQEISPDISVQPLARIDLTESRP